MEEKTANIKKGVSPENCNLMLEAIGYMLLNPELHGKTAFDLEEQDIEKWILKPNTPPHLVDGVNKYKRLKVKVDLKTKEDFNRAIADDKDAVALITEYEKYMLINPEVHGKTLQEVYTQEIPMYIIKPDIPPSLAISGKKYEDIRDEIDEKTIEYYICGTLHE